MSLLVIQKILGLLVKTRTTNDKYSLLDRDKLTQPIQSQIFKKEKKISIFFWTFEICIKNWTIWRKIWPSKVTKSNHLKKKMTLKVFISPKLRTAKDVLRSTAKRPPFTRPFEKWHGKRSQTPLKSALQHLHQIYWSLWIKLSWKESLLVIQKIFGLLVIKSPRFTRHFNK